MEYIFTNLPQYVKITPQSAFSSSIVESGHALLFMPTSSSIMAKLSDGSFITVGGSGTDVSDTTAEAANVQSGYYFYNSAGVKTAGTLTVSGGVDVSSTTANSSDVLSGKLFYNSGGTLTTGTIPTVSASITSGAVVVPSGYIANSQSFPVSSGADVILGYVSSGVFYELGFVGTASIEVASSAGLSSYGWNLPGTGGSSGVALYSGGTIVSSAASMSGISITSLYSMYVYSGGTANSTVVSGGEMEVYRGGTANSTTVYGDTNVHYLMQVRNGAIANSIVLSGGILYVYRGGSASSITVNHYSDINIYGHITDVVVNTNPGHGSAVIYNGGTATSATVNSGGKMVVISALANSVTVSSGGDFSVTSSGTALAVTSMTGATIRSFSGGYIEYVTSN